MDGAWRTVSLGLKLLVSAAAFWLLARQVDMDALGAVLSTSDWTLFCVGAVAYVAGQAGSAYRWLVIARRVGFDRRLGQLVRYYFVGMFFNMFGPATVGGDLVRGLYLAGGEGRRSAALNTVVFDRLVGLVMLVFVLLTAIASFGTFGLPPIIAAAAAGGSVAIVAGWWTLPLVVRGLLRPDNPWRRLVEVELAPLWRDPRLLAETGSLSVFFHVGQVGSVMLVGAAVGLDVPWPYYFVFHPLVSIFSALPISLAGLGIREMGTVYLLSEVAGVPRDTAVAFSILWLGVLLISTLAGGLVFLGSGDPLPARRLQPSPAQLPPSS
ncbi:MAG: lysylphosphatidylglycerol synthase transmembrane domain-containing protein [Candidatus Binatia bacterium]